MNYATKIKFKSGCKATKSLIEINEIYISGQTFEGYYRKDVLYDYLKEHPGTIFVNISPYPEVIPAVSVDGEKYVKSKKDATNKDNLLSLPVE